MPAMMLFGRSAGFLPLRLEVCELLARYSGIWPAIFGFAGAMLLPSAPWQAAQTWVAIFWPFARSAFGAGSAASATGGDGCGDDCSAWLAHHSTLGCSGGKAAEKGRYSIGVRLFACDAIPCFAAARHRHLSRTSRRPAPPEIAFAGRSNAGKSSAINAIVGRTRLAFVSKTPGRTRPSISCLAGDPPTWRTSRGTAMRKCRGAAAHWRPR